MQWNLFWTHQSFVFVFNAKWISVIVLEIIVNSELWHCGWAPRTAPASCISSSELLFHLDMRKAIKNIYLTSRSNKILCTFQINWCKGVFEITLLILCNRGMYPKCHMNFQHWGLGCFCVDLLPRGKRGLSPLSPKCLSAFHCHQRNFFPAVYWASGTWAAGTRITQFPIKSRELHR